ncbi:MAG: Ribonuclease [Gemmataceae bacterium]|nr:Ribonuclease [Gemmataceae bacterium]
MRTEIFTDGSFDEQTRTGGWAAVIVRAASGQHPAKTSKETEFRALIEAVKMAEGPCTLVSDHEGIVRTAQLGKVPVWCKDQWEELYAAMAGKDVAFE